MIKINLLPYREKEKKENLSQQVFIIVGASVIFILCLIWVHVWMNSIINNLETKKKQAEESLVILNKKIGDVENISVIKMNWNKKLILS